MVTVTVSIQTDEGEDAVAIVQDYLLGVVDRIRDFEEKYKDKALPLPAEIVESQKLAGKYVKIEYTIESDSSRR